VSIALTDIDADLDSLSRKLAEEINSDAKQITVLEKRIERNNELLKVVSRRLGAAGLSVKSTGYGSKSDTVQQAIKQISNARFTQDDVEMEIKRANPTALVKRDRIRSVLWHLQKKKDLIQLVRKGNNRQPAEFEKLPSETNGTSVPPPPPPRSVPPPRRTVL
jgi:hypothetical protein